MPEANEVNANVPAVPVVVTPIPATESRTLRLTKVLTWAAPIIGFTPDVIGFLLNLWATDPTFANAVTDFIPVQYRAIIVAIIIGIVQRYGYLRRDTAQPIIGSPGEAKAVAAEESRR